MNGAMLNAIRLQAQRAMADLASTRVGVITSYEPANFSVRVSLQPEGLITGWLPLCSPWIGNGWGMFAAPSVGDMVSVHFFGGDLEAGFVESRMFNDVDRPLSVPTAEFWLVHQTGSSLKFTNDGNVTLHTQADLVATVGGKLNATVMSDASVSVGGNATVNVTGNLSASAAAATLTAPTTINGTLHVTGNITSDLNITAGQNIADQGGAKTMAGMRTAHNAHKGHGTPGTGNVPDTLM